VYDDDGGVGVDGRDRGEMAGDITLKGYSYTLTLALLWKAVEAKSALLVDSANSSLVQSEG